MREDGKNEFQLGLSYTVVLHGKMDQEPDEDATRFSMGTLTVNTLFSFFKTLDRPYDYELFAQEVFDGAGYFYLFLLRMMALNGIVECDEEMLEILNDMNTRVVGSTTLKTLEALEELDPVLTLTDEGVRLKKDLKAKAKLMKKLLDHSLDFHFLYVGAYAQAGL